MERGIQCCASWRMYIVLLREVNRSLELSSKSSMRVEYQRQYKRRSSVRLHIHHTKLKRMQNYFDSNRNRGPEDRYLKCQLEPKPSTRKGKKRPAAVVKPVVTRSRRRKTTLPTANREDHPYSLQSRKSADHSYASRK